MSAETYEAARAAIAADLVDVVANEAIARRAMNAWVRKRRRLERMIRDCDSLLTLERRETAATPTPPTAKNQPNPSH